MEFRCRVSPSPNDYGEWPIDESISNLCGEWQCPAGFDYYYKVYLS